MNYPKFEALVKIIEKLRDPNGGCPWDLKQTHQSLLKFLIEESYEFLMATEEDSSAMMEEEIGDVLLQVLLHCTIAKQNKKFDLESVSQILADKLIRRHPHVFGDLDNNLNPDEVVNNWKKIKDVEKAQNQGTSSSAPLKIFNNDYLKFPALYSAYKIGQKSNQIKFDWDNPEAVVAVVESEWKEFKEELISEEKNSQKIQEELGDLLFSMAQLIRHFKFEPEETLRQANRKFLSRFSKMEDLIVADGKTFDNMNQMQMDVYWDHVKKIERQKKK